MGSSLFGTCSFCCSFGFEQLGLLDNYYTMTSVRAGLYLSTTTTAMRMARTTPTDTVAATAVSVWLLSA